MLGNISGFFLWGCGSRGPWPPLWPQTDYSGDFSEEKWIYFLNVLKVIIFVKFTNLQWYTTTYTSVIVWQVLHPQEVVFVTRHGFFFFVIRSYCVIGQVRVSMSKRMLDVFFFHLPLSMVSRSLFLSWLCGLEGSTVVDLCVMHANFLWLLLYFLIIR